jgi:pimeloyl-ACP methyl ester carboxylesterase
MISLILAAALAAQPAPAADEILSVAGPHGLLQGAFLSGGTGSPTVIIVPGSGPTDRDGNNPLGVKAGSYKALAGALAVRGVTTLRIDKRGMFGSRPAIPDANKVTIADYASDVHRWAAAARQKTHARCVWVAGHSEGGVVALAAAQNRTDICGVITLSAPGRPIGPVMREQFRDNPANAPILAPALAAIDALEKGGSVDVTTLPAPLKAVFNPAVQPFMRDLMRQDPAGLAHALKVPLLIVQGDQDLQVKVADAQLLHQAHPKSAILIVPNMNHVLKTVPRDDAAANFAAYGNPSLPIAPGLADAIAQFVKRHR